MNGINMDEEKNSEKKPSIYKRLLDINMGIFFKLSEDRFCSLGFAIVMIIVVELQLASYMYDEQNDSVFYNGIISDQITILRIHPIFEKKSYNTLYWICQYSYISLIAIYIICYAYAAYSIHIKKFHILFTLRIMQNLSSLFIWILLIPMVEGFVSIYCCTNGFHTIDKNMKCWEGIHIFYCIFFTIMLGIFLLILFLISILYNESRVD